MYTERKKSKPETDRKKETEMKMIDTKNAPAAIGPYSQAVLTGGLLLTSGQLGLDPETGVLPENLEEQTEQSLKNIDAILTAAGYARTDVVKTTVFIRNMNDFGTVNRIYEAYFGEHKPARSCVEVSALPKGGLVEIEAIASR